MNTEPHSPQDAEMQNEAQAGQPLAAHLLELRKRLIFSFIAIFIIFAALTPIANELYQIVSAPLLNSLPEGSQMIATEVASPFLTPFKLAFVVAIFISMPVLLFQVWRFIAPALYSHEKKLFLPIMLFSILLFYGGMAFAYFAVFPVIFALFAVAGPDGVAYTPDISQFLSTALKLFFAFGIAFQIPVATTVLVRGRIVEAQSLSEKRPYIIVGCFVIGMLLTPPDPVSQCMMALPMWILFEIGLILGRILTPSIKPEDD